MKNQDRIDGFLNTALWFLGAAAIWSFFYFVVSDLIGRLMIAFPILLVTAVLASGLFVASFCVARGFPFSSAEAEDRLADRWSEEKKRAFTERYPKRRKTARRLALIAAGMTVPALIDLIDLFLL